jgi:CheY-like chemotaxis protein
MSAAGVSRDDVHDALSHLYDNDLLAHSRLAASFPGIQNVYPIERRADRMRSLLLEAIEVLRPSRRCAFGSPESRHYDVLCLRYLEDMPVTRMEGEISVGRRQLHRDLLEAEARLAEVLASRTQPGDAAPATGEVGARSDPLSSELQALRSQPATVSVHALLQSALRLLAPLAAQAGATLDSPSADGAAAFVTADPAVLRQLLVQLVGAVLQVSAGQTVRLTVEEREGRPVLALRFPYPPSGQLPAAADVQRIAQTQQAVCEVGGKPGAEMEVSLQFRGPEPYSVLVVEDNPGAIELYRRYLAGSGWRVESTSDPRRALALARAQRPDALILDIMMPALDGWGVIEALSSCPETAAIPVIICSVVQDIHLGRVMGAAAYLRKPVGRGELLTALKRCLPER